MTGANNICFPSLWGNWDMVRVTASGEHLIMETEFDRFRTSITKESGEIYRMGTDIRGNIPFPGEECQYQMGHTENNPLENNATLQKDTYLPDCLAELSHPEILNDILVPRYEWISAQLNTTVRDIFSERSKWISFESSAQELSQFNNFRCDSPKYNESKVFKESEVFYDPIHGALIAMAGERVLVYMKDPLLLGGRDELLFDIPATYFDANM